jgi:triacylglycerol lipase
VGTKLELAIGVLNGAVGDWLARTDNGLATRMTLVHEGEPIPATRAALTLAGATDRPRVAVLVHGLMCTESVWTMASGDDYGTLLRRDLGIAPLYVRYNSGLPIPDNGEALATLLESVALALPEAEEIVLIGFSMGGLVIRSATHVAAERGMSWLTRVKRAIYCGTPHLGAPLERVGRVVTRILAMVPDPTTNLVGQIADLRSDGLKDLGDADLRHDDRARRGTNVGLRDPRHPVPLLDGIRHHLAAGSLSIDARLAGIFGDAVVPLSSGTDGACIDAATIALPPDHVRLFPGFVHMAMANHLDVYVHVRAWCDDTTSVTPPTGEAP